MKNLPLILAAAAGVYFLNKPSAKKNTTTQTDKNKDQKKEYPSIFPGRKIIIDQYLNTFPGKFDLDIDIVPLYDMVDYAKWSKNGTEGLYQDWLTHMIYIQIAIAEHLWDTDSADLYLFLECGKKLYPVSIDPPVYDFVTFEETPEQCFNRLLLSRTLWKDINDYIKDNLTSCPPGAKCE